MFFNCSWKCSFDWGWDGQTRWGLAYWTLHLNSLVTFTTIIYECFVPPHGGIFGLHPLRSRNSNLAPYFFLQTFAFVTPLALGISNDPLWERYGYFLELHNVIKTNLVHHTIENNGLHAFPCVLWIGGVTCRDVSNTYFVLLKINEFLFTLCINCLSYSADFGSAALAAPANSFVGTPYW